MNDRFGYKPPIDIKLGYQQSLARLKELFADNNEKVLGHKAEIIPHIFYGKRTADSLQENTDTRYCDWLNTPEKRREIADKTEALLNSYQYVVLGTRSGRDGRRFLEQVLLQGPSVMRHELVQPPDEQLAAAELWRIRSSLFNIAQATALCNHLNSFRRTKAHGNVLEWSVSEGPDPDGSLTSWIVRLTSGMPQLHRSADGLAGFGIDGELNSKVALFKLAYCSGKRSSFTYKPTAPLIEPMYHLRCTAMDDSLIEGRNLLIGAASRGNYPESKRRKEVLEYAYEVGAFIDIPDSQSGLLNEHYYFLNDEESTGEPLFDCGPRPSEAIAELLTAEETRQVMKYLHGLGCKQIRRVQDLKADNWFCRHNFPEERGATLTWQEFVPELGLTLAFKGFYKYDSPEFKRTAERRKMQLKEFLAADSD